MDSIFMFSKSYWLYFSFILNTKLIIQFSICDMEIPAIHNSEAESKPIEHEEESKFALF